MVVVVGSKLTLRLSIFLPQRAERNEVSSKIKKYSTAELHLKPNDA